MSTTVETEVKRIVAGIADLQRFASLLPGPAERLVQLNVYLSLPAPVDPDVSVRLRWVADVSDQPSRDAFVVDGDLAVMVERLLALQAQACLTAKSGRHRHHDVFAATEIEQYLPARDAMAWMLGTSGVAIHLEPDFGSLQDVVLQTHPRIQTWSVTWRDVHEYDGFVIELDETCYADATRDYEVEVEDERAVEASALLDILGHKSGVTLSAQVTSKHARALQHAGRDLPIEPAPG